ncbi:MAG: hypothetical protein WA761_07655 [Thermoplasmata archaeon]
MRPLRPLGPHASSADVSAFLRRTEARLTMLDHGIALADWRLFTGRSSSGSLSWQLGRNEWLSDPALLEFARGAQGTVRGSLLRRRMELLERVVVESQIEQYPPIARARARLQRRITAYRPRWKGRRVDRAEIDTVLRRDPDRAEREKAFYAEQPLYGPLENELRRLVHARNDRARDLGFRSYPAYKLGYEGLTVERLFELMETALTGASRRLREVRARFQERTGLTEWLPWDLPFLHEAEGGLPDPAFPALDLVPAVLEGVRGWGFRPSQLKFRIDEHDLPFGGMEIAVHPPKDVRIIVHPKSGWLWYMVLFHEVGHGIHSRSARASSHLLRGHESVLGFQGLVEGIGGLFEELPGSAEWLTTRPGLDARLVNEFRNRRQETELSRMVSLVGWVRQEIGLYLDPEGDPAAEMLRFQKEMLGFDDFRPLSAADSFTVDSPVYSQSYILAELFDKQILSAVRSQIDGPLWPNPKFAGWLTENWLRYGTRHDWVPRVKEVTGQAFGAEEFVRGRSLDRSL